ncbi:cysteine/glutathione ABC transporter ATP-binding protein/permease CydC [Brenneria goodwinii]|uniref:heme ABC transporter ATP-binding protein/permease CydC n=1 Tax=Brenneria goodwinii TaxID=1109412 RepID=UPI000EF18B24|nr:cysteine/glutathione ABC transporter ATP-binding protein/permease CydC [Brenneria goodwinii]MCG8155053.1 cysteine/glutathione ABC transporter ATP-binding protein/permease CydC [Brenneria goodwinii]MCG8159297.1 cysteine/glutathione ABC transporter ATP-binding protein/permease CydC [Brenneria goodwinii]MCG8164534.1 cysteine/glutathione ABC transporter ATP-binding protein/permease CydC [Brenneria goodwinii]MCG8168900.1 cysteine/glutathione ABC transporter ATP-binding protein/permease CydC [Bren
MSKIKTMQVLKPFLLLYRRHIWRLSLGIILAIVTLLASIGLLTLSGWFLAGAALAGIAGLYTFNYMLPAAGVRGAAIARTASRYAERLVSHDATFRVLQHLRVFTFSRILPLSPGGIARFRQAELLNRLVADVDTLDHLYLRVISPIVSALLVILIVTYGLSWLDVSLALTLCAIMLALLLLLPVIFYRAGQPIGQDLTALRAQYRLQLTTWLQGQAELTVFGALSASRRQLAQLETRWLTRQRQQTNLTGQSQALMLLCSGVTVTLILWLAAAGIGGDAQPGALIALFVFATLAAFEALAPVAGAFQHMGQVIASAARIDQIIRQPAEVTFPEQGPAISPAASLDFNNVSFTYPDQPLAVLKDISLSIRAGEHLALLGRTGCGKSTLLQLLTRAWDCKQGDITLSGHPLGAWREDALRSMMSVVPQRVHIFSATLRDNLLLAAPDARDEQFVTVLQQVGLDKLLENEGLNAWLGEGGRQLSGGEQRRIGLARALLHSAPLVLLDEPTEGLDAETEQRILRLLRRHCEGKTLIVITHRLYELESMDRICVMDGGQIVEQGNHQTLMALQGRYWQFHQHV